MSVDARIRKGLTMIEKELPEVDTVASYENLERDTRHGDRRRRTLIAAAAAVLVAAGVYGVIKTNPDTTAQPAKQPSTTSPQPYRDNGFSKSPGRYRMLVGVTDTGVPINADFTFYDTWKGGGEPVYRADPGYPAGGMAIYTPVALASGTGCLSDQPNTNVGQTPKQLVRQLAHLPQSTVLQRPTTFQASGHEVVHLGVRINQQKCYPDIYRVAETQSGGHFITYGPHPVLNNHPVLINFWVQSLGGTPVVVETWAEDTARGQMWDQIARTEKSIRFVTGP